jgi:hypothetical protein
MSRVLVLVLGFVLAVVSVFRFDLVHAAQPAGCAGAWLVRITLDERDIDEEVLIAFAADGTVEVQAPPVLPALPGAGETPLPASGGLGAWEEIAPGECAFEFVRLLAAEDGVGLGTLDVRGTAAIDDGNLSGSLTYTRATGFGQTAATAAGTFTGTSLSGPLLWLTPTAASS